MLARMRLLCRVDDGDGDDGGGFRPFVIYICRECSKSVAGGELVER
jgi:hypothetical protein